jgi:hypothetical protein
MLTSAGIAVASAFLVVRDIAGLVIFDKLSTGSGLERMMTISLAYGYFQQFPILGIGWGSATSHDLVVKLLSNVGILGSITFLGAMACALRANWQTMGFLDDAMDLSRAAWLSCLAIFLLTSIFLEFPLAFGNFWLILGMAIATGWKEGPAQAPMPALEKTGQP